MEQIEIKENGKLRSIRLYQEMKDEAREKYDKLKKTKEINISEIEKILDIYDVDPYINNFYLEKCLEYYSNKLDELDKEKISAKNKGNAMQCDDYNKSKKILWDNFYDKYLHYISSLTLKQKTELNKKIKMNKNIGSELVLDKISNIEKIAEIFNSIQSSSFNMEKLEKQFFKEYIISFSYFHK